MALQLRYYQTAAVDSVFEYFNTKTGNPLIVLPTATGKSLVIAAFTQKAIALYPQTRILVATHVKELVSQNFLEFYNLCPEIDAGIHSAGLKKRDMHNRVVFCGIQSAYKKAFEFGQVDILLIDEAHTVPPEGEGMWRKFIEHLKINNPNMKVVGLSATPYRMRTGMLTEGDGRIFTDICYEYPLLQAVKDGFVCELVPKPTHTTYDISGVHKRGGEYIPGELQAAINIDEKTIAAVEEVIAIGTGDNRRSWLIFAAGNDHAEAIHKFMEQRGITCAIVTDRTPDGQRDQAVADIKSGRIHCLINNLIFTTGFNAPNIDLIACFRPTQSAGLWVQICGRGFRLHPSKNNTLLLDFGKNLDRHGPLDQITGRKPNKGEGEAPVKVCPNCDAVCFAGCTHCPDCNFKFPEKPLEIEKTASTSAVLSIQEPPVWHPVISMDKKEHPGKDGKPSSMRVVFTTWAGNFSEFVFFNHMGFPREKAVLWHRRMKVADACPNSVAAALKIDYPCPSEICVRKEGKFFRVIDMKFTKEDAPILTKDPEPLIDRWENIPEITF